MILHDYRYLAIAAILLGILVGASTRLDAAPLDEDFAGQVVAELGGSTVSLPLLTSDYAVSIEGTLATVTLKQTFFNDNTRPLNATYLFPLNQKAAVYAMTMEVGDEVVEAQIQRKEEAQKTFETAKSEGKTASLLEQHRPNMFTQNIANLMPQMPVTVTLEYVQTVPKKDAAYELVIPMVVGPRYEGQVPPVLAQSLGMTMDASVADEAFQPQEQTAPAAQIQQESGWTIAKLPAYPKVIGLDAPEGIDPKRVSFTLDLSSANAISGLSSTTHPLEIDLSEHQVTATFAEDLEIDNRDLVVRYELGSDAEIVAGVNSHFDQRGGFLSLEIEPPAAPAQTAVTPRELVFVLDTSGSMNGGPMQTSKLFMETALKSLRPTDHFRVLRFSNNTSQFSRYPMPATPQNIQDGIRFVNGLSAGGGTEMNKAINAAFDQPPVANTLRVVVFLTDGYIGADRQVIQTVSQRIGQARIYAFGVGNAVNRYLLEGIAKEGRGRARFIEVDEAASEVARALAAQIESPLLTDISIDWNGLAVSDMTPSRVPDLFAGESLRLMARYKVGGTHKIIVNGMVNGRPASLPIDLMLENTPTETDSAVPLTWARERVFDLERDYTLSGGTDEQQKQAITRIGLDYSLQTAFTSFVAVSKTVYDETPSATQTASVPVPQVKGVNATAYPTLNLGGSSTPEPETMIGFVIAIMMIMLRFRRALMRQAAWLRGRFARRYELQPGLPKRLINDGWWLV